MDGGNRRHVGHEWSPGDDIERLEHMEHMEWISR